MTSTESSRSLIFRILLITAACTIVAGEQLHAQNNAVDTLPGANESLTAKPRREYKPNKAALLSTVLPGAGQFYNRSYWKIPLVWGGLVTFGALAYYNNQQAQDFQAELDYRENNTGERNSEYARYSDSSLERGRDQSIRYRDLNIILGVIWYGLNVMDAYVDAHLKEFEVSDNLALGINPELYSNGIIYQPGLSLGLKFRP